MTLHFIHLISQVQVPIAIIADSFVKKQGPSAAGVGGAVLVVVGCLLAAIRRASPQSEALKPVTIPADANACTKTSARGSCSNNH